MSDVVIGNAIIAGIADGDTVLEKMSEIIDHLRLAGFEIVPVGGGVAQRPLSRWRHKKRGKIYQLLGDATIQTETPLSDNDPVVVYRREEDGGLRVRPGSEFFDGRFEEVSAVTSTECAPIPPGHELCSSCGRIFKFGETCTRGGCPCGGDV